MRPWHRRPIRPLVRRILTEDEGRRDSTYVSEANVLDDLGVQLGLGQHLLQEFDKQVIQRRILEATLPGLGQWRSQGESDNDIVRVLLRTMLRQWMLACLRSCGSGWQALDLHGGHTSLGGRKMGENGL
jgi:hypothetical protein